MFDERYLIQPNEWIKEELLIQLTGMSSGEIKNYRCYRWVQGVHFKRSSSMNGKAGRNYKYNRLEIDKFSTKEDVA